MFYEISNAVAKQSDKNTLLGVCSQLVTDGVDRVDLVAAFMELDLTRVDSSYRSVINEVVTIVKTTSAAIDS